MPLTSWTSSLAATRTASAVSTITRSVTPTVATNRLCGRTVVSCVDSSAHCPYHRPPRSPRRPSGPYPRARTRSRCRPSRHRAARLPLGRCSPSPRSRSTPTGEAPERIIIDSGNPGHQSWSPSPAGTRPEYLGGIAELIDIPRRPEQKHPGIQR